MAQLLSSASAFNPGHDLWAVPDLAGSRWSLRLDWYLNFQITRAFRSQRTARPPELNGILQEIDWEPGTNKASERSPLLISAEGRLPARWIVVVPESADLADWVLRLETVWRNLQRPTLKVFLPTGLMAATFGEEWKRRSEDDDYGLVLDQDPLLQ